MKRHLACVRENVDSEMDDLEQENLAEYELLRKKQARGSAATLPGHRKRKGRRQKVEPLAETL